RDARLPYRRRDLLVRVRVLLLERRVAFGLFDRRQVFALEVLDERDLEELVVRDRHLDTGHLVEARFERGAEPALAGDDREAPVVARADEDRLEHPLVGDRRAQSLEIAERAARLIGIRFEEV